MSPVPWLMVAGLLLVWSFLHWEARMVKRRQEPLVDPALLRNKQLGGGLIMFFFQYFLMMGVFFLIPLYLSVALGLSAIDTGVRILPMSLTLLAAALGVPRLLPHVSPRLVVRVGILLMLLGLLVLLAAIDVKAGAEIVTVPLLLVGLGIGGIASQLGAVTVSAVPDERSSEVGGLQNTVTNLGASLGTALAGSILIAVLTASFLTHIDMNNAVPQAVKDKAHIELAAGIPFMSDKQLEAATQKAGASSEVTHAALAANAQARLDGLRAGLTVLILIAAIALFLVGRMPTRQPGSEPALEPAVAVAP
jgi:Na+/melibiose symporter-like transporter